MSFEVTKQSISTLIDDHIKSQTVVEQTYPVETNQHPTSKAVREAIDWAVMNIDWDVEWPTSEGVDEQIVTMLDKRSTVFYRRKIMTTTPREGSHDEVLNSPKANSYFDLDLKDEDFVIRFVGTQSQDCGTIMTIAKSKVPSRRVSFFATGFWKNTIYDNGNETPTPNNSGNVNVNRMTWRNSGPQQESTGWYRVNDTHGILASNQEIWDAYVYFELTGHMYQITAWVVRTEGTNTGANYNRGPYTLIVRVQKAPMKLDDPNDLKVAPIEVEWN